MAVALASLAMAPTMAAAQASLSPGTTLDTLAEARRARDAKNFPRAVRLLEGYVAAHPRDIEGVWILAETRYWLGDARGARAVLEPLRRNGPTRGEAEALLGTLAYWTGDLTRAVRHFRSALAVNPRHASARRQLEEIGRVTAPWIALSGRGQRDDQPVRSLAGTLEMGWFATPLTSAAVRVTPSGLGGRGRELVVTTAELALSGYLPSLRLEWRADGGAMRRDPILPVSDPSTQWIGGAHLGLRLPGGMVVSGEADRAIYLDTEASLDSMLYRDAARARIEWSPRSGWLGEAAYGVHRFPDGNVVTSAYAWVLAPLVRRAGGELLAGYAVAWQDARESRFVFSSSSTPVGGGPSSGRYAPYYTPERMLAHSLTGALMVRAGTALTIRADGSFGIHATEWVPVQDPFTPGPGAPGAGEDFALREFQPWRARVVLGATPTRALTFELSGEQQRQAFYEVAELRGRIVWRVLPRSVIPRR